MGIYVLAPLSAAATQSGNPTKNIAVTGTNITDATLDITRFAVQSGKIVALATLKGTVNGQQVTQQITLPVTIGQHTCEILHLELGPLDLDLLGLKVHLDKVVLDITAQSGPGNLLGNLLCSVAQLLDNTNASLSAIVAKLNDILRALG
jgi:hypothetical protein